MKPVDPDVINEHYKLVASLSDHPIYEDDNGVYRFKRNKALWWAFESGMLDLNKLWVAFVNHGFPLEDMMQIWRMLGYSLGGFEEVFAEQLDEMEKKTDDRS
jgi:hypothetical protein